VRVDFVAGNYSIIIAIVAVTLLAFSYVLHLFNFRD